MQRLLYFVNKNKFPTINKDCNLNVFPYSMIRVGLIDVSENKSNQ